MLTSERPARTRGSGLLWPLAELFGSEGDGVGKVEMLLVDTGGKQRHIFGSNKLREQIGASQQVHEVGTEWLSAAIKEAAGVAIDGLGAGDGGWEVVLSTSGKALVVCPSGTARDVLRSISQQALEAAPGLEVTGLVSPEFEWGMGKAKEVSAALHQDMAKCRSQLPPTALRFPRVPFVASCATSDFPAAGIEKGEARSAVAAGKRAAADKGWKRIQQNRKLARAIDGLESGRDIGWLAVVHADGNGMGARFRDVAAAGTTDDEWADALRHLSTSADQWTNTALDRTLEQMFGDNDAPVVPVLVGGDDVTVVVDGRYGLKFARLFLSFFEEVSGSFFEEVSGLTACAGVAIVKPHYPIASAYDIAESLVNSAKRASKADNADAPPSSFDVHVVRDSTAIDVADARERSTGAGVRMAGPFSVADLTEGAAAAHLVPAARLDEVRACISQQDVPSGPVASLREALRVSATAAEAEFTRLSTIHGSPAWLTSLSPLLDSRGRSVLLDAMELNDVGAPT